MNITEKLAELKKLDAERTQGPWYEDGLYYVLKNCLNGYTPYEYASDNGLDIDSICFPRKTDAPYIVSATNHFAALVEIAEAANMVINHDDDCGDIWVPELRKALQKLGETK